MKLCVLAESPTVYNEGLEALFGRAQQLIYSRKFESAGQVFSKIAKRFGSVGHPGASKVVRAAEKAKQILGQKADPVETILAITGLIRELFPGDEVFSKD